LRFWLQTIELEILCHTRGMPKTYPPAPKFPRRKKVLLATFENCAKCAMCVAFCSSLPRGSGILS